MNAEDILLSKRLALASHELRSHMPPATLLPAIHRQLDRRSARPQRRRWLPWAGWAGFSTAAAALAVAFVVNAVIEEQAPPTVLGDDGFVRLVTNEVWQRAQTEASGTWLVSTELPHSRLAALGLPYDPSRAGERVRAELLMHGSGEVLAVRLAP